MGIRGVGTLVKIRTSAKCSGNRRRRLGGGEREERGRKGFILYTILTNAHTQKKRAAVISLGHRR